MKILLAVIIITFPFFQVLAQDKFGTGYYLTNAGDTVRGFIEYKAGYDEGFKFKPNLKASTQRIAISQVKSLAFTSGTSYARVEYPATGNLPATPVFVRQVVDGEVDLFYHEGRMYLGSEKRGRFALSKKRSSNGAESLKNQQNNLGAFNILFQDCPAVQQEAQKTFVSEENLAKLLRSYHECRGLQYREFTTVYPRRKVHVGFFAGQSVSALNFGKPANFPETSYLYNSDFGTSSHPTFGVMTLIGGRSPYSIFAFQGGLSYTKAEYRATWSYTKGDFGGYDITKTTDTHVEYSMLSLTAGGRISGRSNNLNPYVAFGLATHQFLSLDEGVYQITTINASTEDENFKLGMVRSALAVWASAGLQKRIGGKALFAEASYENSHFAIDDPKSAQVTVMAFRVGFMF